MNARTRRTLATTTAMVAGTVALAGPAAADHVVEVRATSCSVDRVAGGFYGYISTDLVTVVDNGDGTVTGTCVFRKLPKKVQTEWDGLWVRPRSGTTYNVSPCSLYGVEYEGLPHYDEWYGIVDDNGTVSFQGNRATVTCTFDLADPGWY